MANGSGKWPRALRRFLEDFKPAGKALVNDGIIAPEEKVPEWIGQVSHLASSLDTVRRAREDAENRAKTAEDKAARLIQIVLALLTVTLALGSYQLGYTFKHSHYWLLSLIPVTFAICSLALSAFEALQVDRVGMYAMPTGSDLKGAKAADVSAVLLRAEEHGRMLADWTANHKHTDLMQARAWMTRGLAALVIAGLLAGVTRALPPPAPAQHRARSAGYGVHVVAPDSLRMPTALHLMAHRWPVLAARSPSGPAAASKAVSVPSAGVALIRQSLGGIHAPTALVGLVRLVQDVDWVWTNIVGQPAAILRSFN